MERNISIRKLFLLFLCGQLALWAGIFMAFVQNDGAFLMFVSLEEKESYTLVPAVFILFGITSLIVYHFLSDE
jgi:hypothetical protein